MSSWIYKNESRSRRWSSSCSSSPSLRSAAQNIGKHNGSYYPNLKSFAFNYVYKARIYLYCYLRDWEAVDYCCYCYHRHAHEDSRVSGSPGIFKTFRLESFTASNADFVTGLCKTSSSSDWLLPGSVWQPWISLSESRLRFGAAASGDYLERIQPPLNMNEMQTEGWEGEVRPERERSIRWIRMGRKTEERVIEEDDDWFAAAAGRCRWREIGRRRIHS